MIHDTPGRGNHYTKWRAADDTERHRRAFDCRPAPPLEKKIHRGDVRSVDAAQWVEMALTAGGIAPSDAAEVPPTPKRMANL